MDPSCRVAACGSLSYSFFLNCRYILRADPSTLRALYFPWRAVSVNLIIRLHFYLKPDQLSKPSSYFLCYAVRSCPAFSSAQQSGWITAHFYCMRAKCSSDVRVLGRSDVLGRVMLGEWRVNIRSKCSVNMHIVRKCKRLQVLFPIRLAVRNLILKPLLNRLTKPLSLSVCLRMVGCCEIKFGTQYSAYKADELGK